MVTRGDLSRAKRRKSELFTPQSSIVEIRAKEDHQYHCAHTRSPHSRGYADPLSSQPSLTIRSLGNGTTCTSCAGAAPSGQYASHEVAPRTEHAIFADNMTLASTDSVILNALRTATMNRLNMTFTKDQLLDVEYDIDHLDEDLDDTPHDRILNQELDVDHGSLKSIKVEDHNEFRSKAKALMKNN